MTPLAIRSTSGMLRQMRAARMVPAPVLSLHPLPLPREQASGGSGPITAQATAPGAQGRALLF